MKTNQQKWSSCSWLLLREFVRLHREREEQAKESGKELDPYGLPSVTYVSQFGLSFSIQ